MTLETLKEQIIEVNCLETVYSKIWAQSVYLTINIAKANTKARFEKDNIAANSNIAKVHARTLLVLKMII